MQLDRKPRPACGGEHAGDLVPGKRDALAEPVDRIDQAFASKRRDHFVGDFGDIGSAVVSEFRRQRVRAEESRPDRDRALIGEPAGDAERFALGAKFESIAGLNFNCPGALRYQGVHPPQRRLHQFFLSRGAGSAYG